MAASTASVMTGTLTIHFARPGEITRFKRISPPEHDSAEGGGHTGSMVSRERLTRCCPPSSVSRTSTR